MAGPRRTIALSMAAIVLAAAVAMPGCTSSPPPANRTAIQSAPTQPIVDQATGSNIRPNQPGYVPERQALGSTEALDPEAMQQVVADVQQLGALDPAAREELLENLKQTDPRLWPLVAQQVRANLAWRRQTQEREKLAAPPEVSPDASSSSPAPPAGQTAMRPAPPRDGVLRPEGPPESDFPRTGHPPASESVVPPPPGQKAPDEPPGQVIAASYVPKSTADWQTHLEKAVELLESEVARSPQSDREFAQHARLRMLYLAGDRRDEALRPIPSLASEMQEFWSEQLYGLATLMDTALISESSRRTAEAKQHLDAAVTKLGQSCPLVVRNLAFATEIELFGRFKPFAKSEFKPGQKVLLYAELENFRSQETPRGFHTATRSSYQIFDSSGRRVAEHEFAPSEEYCPNPRRDYFIGYEFSLPERIFPGRHVLQLTVVDLNSQKIGQSLIEFTIKSTGD